MPIEYTFLKDREEVFQHCPECGQKPFVGFMRGQVQSRVRRILGKTYCAVICSNCKKTLGWEKPLLIVCHKVYGRDIPKPTAEKEKANG